MVSDTEIIVDMLYKELEDVCRTYLPDDALQRIYKAFLFAREAHTNQTRKSGEPFITHPLTIAYYLSKHYLDETVLVGALLHDVAEDTTFTLNDIEREFGTQTRHLVDGVTHLKDVSQLEDIAHLFLAMSSDVRVVLVKLFDRLHNMRTLGALPAEKRRYKAVETLRIYVPLAAKLGMWNLKTEFETLILYNIDPVAHDMICDGMDTLYRQEEPRLREISQTLQRILRDNQIPCGVRIKQRSPYRVYERMNGNKLDKDAFAQAFQVIIQVDSLTDCYLALGHIHNNFAHVSGSLSDTIGSPRDIFYRSLHTTIIVPRHKTPIPVRIRTYDFDRQSEIGILAQVQFVDSDQQKQPPKAPWLPQLPLLFHESEDAQRFVETVFQDILQKHITCFTPRGEEISLPRGATVLDFAYHVHTDIGHECRGGIVNGRSVELNTKLSDGDQVEIIRSKGASPHHEWLDDTLEYAITSRAKRTIREWFRRQDEETLIRRGQEILREERRRLNAAHVTAQRLAKELNLDAPQILYLQIGNGTIPISDIARAIIQQTPDVFTIAHRQFTEVTDHLGRKGYLENIGDQKIQLARCCQPTVGDDIIGAIRGGSLMVHRRDCRFVMAGRRSEILIKLEWLETTEPQMLAYLRLEGYDRLGLLRDVSVAIARAHANIIQVDSFVEDKSTIFRLKLELQAEDDLILVIHRLALVQNITQVQRMSPKEIEQWEVNA